MGETKDIHVVCLPLPAQGHIKPMLKLAELLAYEGDLQLTFVITDYLHRHLLRSTDLTAFTNHFPKFHFVTIPDGLPPAHPRSWSSAVEILSSLRAVTAPKFRELMISITRNQHGVQKDIPPPTCIISDGIMSFAIDAAKELQIPIFTFRTYSASCTWTTFHLSKLIQHGEVPLKDKNLDEPVSSMIPGLKDILRRRDLPSQCRCEKVDDPILQFYIRETSAMAKASALILNTFDGLEAPFVSHLGSIFPKIYTLGPLHALSRSFVKYPLPLASSSGIKWKEDRSCKDWLDLQQPESVIYVSFGSVVWFSQQQMLELWHGLVNSGKPFLWVNRPNTVIEADGSAGRVPDEIDEGGVKEKWCVVSWAPQEEILSHSAIGGFLTHSGWNSTLESIHAGVPMICWPRIADQQVNSRCVSHLWRVGLDMKDTGDRWTVEKMVRDLMEIKREEIMRSTDQIAKMARDSVMEGGSSYCNLKRMIDDIRSMAGQSVGSGDVSCSFSGT